MFISYSFLLDFVSTGFKNALHLILNIEKYEVMEGPNDFHSVMVLMYRSGADYPTAPYSVSAAPGLVTVISIDWQEVSLFLHAIR